MGDCSFLLRFSWKFKFLKNLYFALKSKEFLQKFTQNSSIWVCGNRFFMIEY
ncbi:hypothetical protein HMPREF9178_0856 [Streptococcus mitis bv. 2 str. F0392]|uniref:Uncharacterized protein n=1 Tax=Streptococcus mitis bv. 2 str. F0392 TaxID=768726 RepID=F9NYZ2_STROR|nr:hypothetical protein HMPREF9178_0856 [Streptococcus mitis bv. 2 str. F0392]